jgi:FtsZ-interacting cell division protein ZipA
MTDLQTGLLVIGAVAVAGVLVYNRLQERATRRKAEEAFGSKHSDVLMGAPAERKEPTLDSPPGTTEVPASSHASSQPVTKPSPPAPDPRVDYVLELRGTSAGAVRPEWAALQRRFPRRASLAEAPGKKVQAALQMVSRNGVVSENELLEFRSQVETMAAAHGASVSAPPLREALEAAQALDRACAELDVQIALHVLGAADTNVKKNGFSVAPRTDGVTLLLDVPRTPDLAKTYAAMVEAARRLGGRMVDDNGNNVDERALAAIGVEIESLRARMTEIGVEPGSPLALRLFS